MLKYTLIYIKILLLFCVLYMSSVVADLIFDLNWGYRGVDLIYGLVYFAIMIILYLIHYFFSRYEK